MTRHYRFNLETTAKLASGVKEVGPHIYSIGGYVFECRPDERYVHEKGSYRYFDIYSGTCLMYEPLTDEYLDGMTHGAFAQGNGEACREWCQYAAAVAFAAFMGELFL